MKKHHTRMRFALKNHLLTLKKSRNPRKIGMLDIKILENHYCRAWKGKARGWGGRSMVGNSGGGVASLEMAQRPHASVHGVSVVNKKHAWRHVREVVRDSSSKG